MAAPYGLPTTGTSREMTGLSPGTKHTFYVVAEDRFGEGPPSNTASVTTAPPVAKPPGAPSDLRVTRTGKTTITLDWTPPKNDGGDPISGYVIYIVGYPPIPISSTVPPTGLKNLVPGTTYVISIVALTMAGEGPRPTPLRIRLECGPAATR